jgi:uncharacterized membrane protein
MNRQQFLAELNQYLTFFSPQERAAVIAEFGEKFDAAGAEGESALIMELGTPMRVAIDLKRRKESGDKVTFSSVNIEVSSDGFMERYSVETETYESMIAPESIEGVLEYEELETPIEAALVSGKKVSPVKHVFALIGSSVLSILIAAFFLTVAAAGVMLIVAMCYLLLAGLRSLLYVNDALLLFGGGLVLGGAGLLITWFGLWSAISLIVSLFRGTKKLSPNASKKECAA